MRFVSGDDGELRRRIGDAELVREAFEELSLPVAAMDGPQLRFVAANAAYRALATEPEFIGEPLREVFPGFVGQQVFEEVERVFETGEPYTMREWRMQFAADAGSDDPRELYLDVTLVPRVRADGSVRGVLGYISDVTWRVRERTAAQAETAAAERRYERARDVIATLQRELLPAGVPVLPGIEIAASYLLADADTAAGGDWFDAVPLPGGRVALVVGDVVGHGVHAAAVMGQLRVLLAEQLADTGDIGSSLEAVDRYAQRVRGARSATVCVVVLDPDSGGIDYATAGHPPPLVVPAGGQPRYLAATGSGPLATSGEFLLGRDLLEPGDLVLLYTDGILERPGRDLGGASVELAQVAADVTAGRGLVSTEPTTVERVATQSLELLTRATGHTDDITLLAAQRTPPIVDFAVRAVAVPDTIGEVRDRLARWLAGAHVAAADAQVLQHAVGELVTNTVEHAYRDPDPGHPDAERSRPVEVTAAVTRSGEVRIEVRDQGRWREPRTMPPATGVPGRLGLPMTAKLVDQLVLEHPGGATVAFVIHQLVRPARLLTADILTGRFASAATAPGPLDIEQAPAGGLRISGPIDATTAPDVAAELTRASAAGTRRLLVDLTGVTHLASAGVSVLHEAELRSLANGVQLRLHAPVGSPADQILTLVALPHTTGDAEGESGRQL